MCLYTIKIEIEVIQPNDTIDCQMAGTGENVGVVWRHGERIEVWVNVDRCNEWEGTTCVKVPETKESKACVKDRGDIIMAEEMDNTDSS